MQHTIKLASLPGLSVILLICLYWLCEFLCIHKKFPVMWLIQVAVEKGTKWQKMLLLKLILLGLLQVKASL